MSPVATVRGAANSIDVFAKGPAASLVSISREYLA